MIRKIFTHVLILLIRIYQTIFSPDQGLLKIFFRNQVCKFYPTCSEYSILVIKKYGVLKGIKLSFKRISRCHPWSEGGVDLP